MKNMSLKEIARACGGSFHGESALLTKEVSSVVIDSRKVQKGSLFIAIRGARVDGHSFIPQVMENGALCAVSEQDLGAAPYPYIKVASCEQALKDLAAHYRRSLDIKVVGISGSVGKTSTKEMIASVLSQKFCVLKTEGNFNNEIGLPLTVFNLREEHQIAVLEMGISGFGEMSRLAKVARPDICVITNIGFAHLENLGSRDGILRAKTEMFRYMNPNGTIILNGDDDKLFGFCPENGLSPVYFGLDTELPFHAEHIESCGLKGTKARFVTPVSRFEAHIPIPGDHMVYNALAGIAVGYALGMEDGEIRRGIEALVPISGRNHLIETGRFTILDDCYNANPASMRSSIDVLCCADTRKVAILGDMFELGPTEKGLHYEVGKYAVNAGSDVVICIGELSAETARGALDMRDMQNIRNMQDMRESGGKAGIMTAIKGGFESDGQPGIYHFKTKEDFCAKADTLLKDGDTILVKASHGMEFSRLVSALERY